MSRHRTHAIAVFAVSTIAPALIAGPQAQRAPSQSAPKTVPAPVHLFIPYEKYSQEDNQRILKLFEPLRVSDVSDGMDVVGLQDIVDPGIQTRQ